MIPLLSLTFLLLRIGFPCKIFTKSVEGPFMCQLQRYENFSRDHVPYPGLPILSWQYAQPVHIAAAARKRHPDGLYEPTDDVSKADVIFIDDSCLYVASHWTRVNHKSPVIHQNHRVTQSLYSNTVLKQRDSYLSQKDLSGTVAIVHPSSFHFIDDRCGQSLRVFQSVIEERQICPTVRRSLVPNWQVIPGTVTRNPFYDPEKNDKPWLLFFHGYCTNDVRVAHHFYAGNILRNYVVRQIKDLNISNAYVSCDPRGDFDREEMLRMLSNSTFCFVAPGDSPSARRLSEVVAAGCIPLIIGPPHNELAWSSEIDYSSFAMLFTLRLQVLVKDRVFQGLTYGADHWMRPNATDSIHSIAYDRQVKKALSVNSVAEIMEMLKTIPRERVAELQRGLRKVQHMFVYADNRTEHSEDAAVAVLKGMCKYALSRSHKPKQN